MGLPPIRRTTWRAVDLNNPEVGSLWSALLKYRQKDSRVQTEVGPNLISSKTNHPGMHLPLIDLDIPHDYLPSSTPGRAHIYLNESVPTWRWVILMWGLRVGRVTDKGFFWWSLRRGGNYVRLPGVRKTERKT